MKFEIVGETSQIETIASDARSEFCKCSTNDMEKGAGERKKVLATVKLIDESFRLAEIHWYEAHGSGRKDLKIKFPFLD